MVDLRRWMKPVTAGGLFAKLNLTMDTSFYRRHAVSNE